MSFFLSTLLLDSSIIKSHNYIGIYLQGSVHMPIKDGGLSLYGLCLPVFLNMFSTPLFHVCCPQFSPYLVPPVVFRVG